MAASITMKTLGTIIEALEIDLLRCHFWGSSWRGVRLRRDTNVGQRVHNFLPSEDVNMTSQPRATAAKPKRAKSASPQARGVRSKPTAAKRTKKSATDIAISTELAPAVAIALLEKTEQAPGDPAPALDCLAAAAAPSETTGKVRVELLFENGAVLPVEMSNAAGAALSKRLSEDVPKK